MNNDGSLVLRAKDVRVTYEVREDHMGPSLKGMLTDWRRRRQCRVVEAVRGATLELREGEAVGLVGRNGSGKSSLLRAAAGLMPVSAGSVEARSQPILLGVGAALHPELSGRRNVVLGASALGLSRAAVAEHFDSIVAFAGLEEHIDLPLRAFSSGMSARLKFAIATAVNPDILFIDEALSVGDAQFQKKSRERMREVMGRAGAIVLVSHNLGSISEICTRVIWMEDGRIREDGETARVVEAYRETSSEKTERG